MFTQAIAPAILSNDIAGQTGNTGAISANTVYLYLVEFQAPVAVMKARWRNGGVGAGTTNMALYTLAGNLIAGSDTGAQANAVNTTGQFVYATPINLAAGQYFLALASSSGTDTYQSVSPAATDLSHARRATNVLAGGAMPATTGAIVANPASMPAMAFNVSGGL